MLDRRFVSISLIVLGIANEPDANTANGSQYIVGSNPTGSFAGASANSIARYDGSAWKFSAPKSGEMEVLNASNGEFLAWNGSAWNVAITINRNSNIAPVLAVVPTGTTLPASASAGDTFFKTDNAKLYTATAADSWDSGTATTDGSRYASSSDFKIYTSDGSAATSEDVPEGGFFLNKEDNCLYVYNGSTFVKIGGNSGSAASTATDVHSLTAAEVTAKSFTLTNSIKSGEESNVLLFVSGVAQAAGTDFTASGSSISWNSKGLDSIGLIAGDTFIVHYVKA
ncbi:MAG: DUF2793 domain-containing protein [Synergistaceae bacterium]|nr:DUF2793 domain-containing protein [Synergistaceae bacterium]